MSRTKVKVVKALVVEVHGINRTYRNAAQATIAIVDLMLWRARMRNLSHPCAASWSQEKRDQLYKRAYPRVNKIVKRMMGAG